ncbi:hypothetical protein KY285_023563 [Solanum tuberosum]|nr:hypothetical protein KY285_023563 [Solanum tuberosum]
MSNPSSPPKSPLSQEIKIPSSFNFSIPHPEGSPSTLVCRAQLVVKPITKTPAEDLEVMFLPRLVSSTMSERLFKRDLFEGKGMESNILVATEELVTIESLASLRGDTQPTLLEEECKSLERVPLGVQPVFDQTLETRRVDNEEEDEEETSLVWSRKGIRGANASTVVVSDLGAAEAIPEIRFRKEPTDFERKKRGKEREKWLNHPTREIRGDMQQDEQFKSYLEMLS